MDAATQSALKINKPPIPSDGSVAQRATALQDKMSGIQADASKQLADLPVATMPEADFHPLPKHESSQLSSILMVLGALGGRSTMQPATAALNNMTAVMQGQKEGNDQMVKEQKDQFKMNFQLMMQKHKEYVAEKQQILEKYHYDMAAAQGELQTLKLEHGISNDVAKHDETTTNHSVQAMQRAQKLAQDLQLTHEKIAATGSRQDKALEARFRAEATAELAKTTNPDKINAINQRLEANLATITAKPADNKPVPTQADIDYAKAHPDTIPAFKAHFGRAP